MKNFIQKGETKSWVNDTGLALVAGAVVQIGSRVAVCINNIAIGATGEVALRGVFSLPKLTTAVTTDGLLLNWNNTTREFQTATSTLDGAAIATEVVGSGPALVECEINPGNT
jgi:predicted RecA/RadA family phage recombinase